MQLGYIGVACFFLLFFFKFLADTCPFLGPLDPLFWISGDVSSGVQSQSGFCLIRFFAEANVMYIPQDGVACFHSHQYLNQKPVGSKLVAILIWCE